MALFSFQGELVKVVLNNRMRYEKRICEQCNVLGPCCSTIQCLVKQCVLYNSLDLSIVHKIEQFRSHMIMMMDVDMCLLCALAREKERETAILLFGRPPFERRLHLD